MNTQLIRIAIVISLFATGAVTSISHAVTVKLANLQDLVEQSDRIFVGRCISAENGKVHDIPYSRYTFQVIESVKGVDAETVTIQQFGALQSVQNGNSTGGGGTGIAGMPHYSPEQEFLLFLVPESPIGLSSTAGLAQGAFAVRGVGKHRKLVNGVNNANVTKRLPASWSKTGRLASTEVDRLNEFSKGPIEYRFFVDVVRKLSVVAP